MVAIGEPASPTTTAHLRHCPRCAEELEAYRRVVRAGKSSAPGAADLLEPPPGLWDSVAGELGLSGAPCLATPGSGPGTGAPRGPARPPSGSRRTGLARGRRFALALAACAALAGAAAGSGATWWALRDGTAPSARTGPADGADGGTRLAALVPHATGYARLSADRGRRALDITVRGLPRTSGYYEVWLMDRSHRKLISMGVLGADGHAALPVPSTVDLDEYAVVDVSVQKYDGTPAHSGDSVVRGPYSG